MKTKYFECACQSVEHTLRFVYDFDEGEKDLYVDVYLSQDVWYRRWIKAFKYALGIKSSEGHFDCWMMKEEHVDSLMDLLKQYKGDK